MVPREHPELLLLAICGTMQHELCIMTVSSLFPQGHVQHLWVHEYDPSQ